MADFIFHVGIYGSIVTGAIMEISNLIPTFASLFNGLGWLISWSHGVTGIFLIVGGVGFVLRYLRNASFRLACGRTFYVDFPFLLVIGVTGILQALAVFGLMPIVGFTSTSLQWVVSLHVTIIYIWLVASLFLGGSVRHGLATVVWTRTDPEKKHSLFLTFSDACGRCGRCVEFCAFHDLTGGGKVEAPVLKLRRYFKMIENRFLPINEVQALTEHITACTMCGLCTGVCPFSFNFIDMYKELLAYARKINPTPTLVQNVSPKAI